MNEVRRVPADCLAETAAALWVGLAEEAIGRRGRFSVALAGGNTPRDTYARLAGPNFASRVAWANVHVFWGDERCVPVNHIDSNYRMAWETWLAHVPIPTENLHRMAGELDPQWAAEEYEARLRTFFTGEEGPRFDLVLLGLGTDGHAASMYPGTDAIREHRRWVVAQHVDRLSAWRLTLTPVVINAARHVTFVVSGAAKAAVLKQVLLGPHEPDRLPAQIVDPKRGLVVWLVDEAAAAELPDHWRDLRESDI